MERYTGNNLFPKLHWLNNLFMLNCLQKKKKNNNDDCSMALKNEQDIISLTDPHLKSLNNCSLTDNIKDMIQKEKDNEFDIVFLNNQHQLEIQTINI